MIQIPHNAADIVRSEVICRHKRITFPQTLADSAASFHDGLLLILPRKGNNEGQPAPEALGEALEALASHYGSHSPSLKMPRFTSNCGEACRNRTHRPSSSRWLVHYSRLFLKPGLLRAPVGNPDARKQAPVKIPSETKLFDISRGAVHQEVAYCATFDRYAPTADVRLEAGSRILM
ncbi:MAG TPA: hypothetical protein VL156_17200 [Terriglobales bacterium]|jgi:hypothetical protein|nr:hypothetical protein [Terriglobales bacterium]